MTRVAVVVDSTASLPAPMYDLYQMVMVPYHIHYADRVALDLVEVGPAQFNDYLGRLGPGSAVPKTANPSPGQYLQVFLDLARQAREIISFHMTSIGSGAYQAALVARELALQRLGDVRIEVVDTRNVSMAHGWIALQAARAACANASLDTILAEVRRMMPLSRMLQTADTLRYLYLGGRIGRLGHLVGSALNIRPIVSMEDGEIVLAGVARTRDGAYRRIAALVERALGTGRRVRLALTHASAEAEAIKLLSLVEKVVTPVEVLMCELCPALAVHSGPGTVGLCYLQEPG